MSQSDSDFVCANTAAIVQEVRIAYGVDSDQYIKLCIDPLRVQVPF